MRTRALKGEVAIPAAANTALFTVVVAGNLVCGLALPTILLPHSSAWLLLLVPLVGLSATHWALIHEAVHAHLHPSGAANEAGGRMLGILFGASFAVLRFGHLSHHSLNATPTERPELYDPRTSSRLRAAAVFYFRLFIGIYVAEFLSAPLSFLPRRMLRPMVRKVFYDGASDARGMADRAERQLLERSRLARIRLDSGLTLAWLALCLWLYGVFAWAFALAVLGRGVVISFMDNAPHYHGEIGDPGQGYDMQAPRLMGPLILNTNLHGTHHRHPNLPWTLLPRAFAADGAAYAGSYFVVPLRQLQGPIPIPAVPA